MRPKLRVLQFGAGKELLVNLKHASELNDGFIDDGEDLRNYCIGHERRNDSAPEWMERGVEELMKRS